MSIHSVICDPPKNQTACGVRLAGLLVGFWIFAGAPLGAWADPIPKGTHDRTLTVRLTPEAVVVAYRLDVAPFTAIFEDLPALAQGEEFKNLVKDHEYYEAFTRAFGPRLADGLKATLDDRPLSFRCVEYRYQEVDPQNHLRCEFVFRAPWNLRPGAKHRFAFQEANFKSRPGRVTLALNAAPGVRRLVPRLDLDPDLSPEERSRRAETIFRLAAKHEAAEPEDATSPKDEGGPDAGGAAGAGLESFLNSDDAFWVLLLFAVFWGAAHALSPGHGKTLAAAYLVGERGTIGHAILLGLVTTLTHTGVVLLVAWGLWYRYPNGIPVEEYAGVKQALELGGGILIAILGFWLLLRRLSGKADHVHLWGGHHYHHHGHSHDHNHDHDHDHDHTHS